MLVVVAFVRTLVLPDAQTVNLANEFARVLETEVLKRDIAPEILVQTRAPQKGQAFSTLCHVKVDVSK